MHASRHLARAASLPLAKSAILSAPEQTSSITVMFAMGIVGILERDGCDDGLNFCDGENEVEGLIVVGVLIQSILNTFTVGVDEGLGDKDGDVDGRMLGEMDGVMDDAGSMVGLLVHASLF